MRIQFNWKLLKKLWFSILMILGGIGIITLIIVYAFIDIDLLYATIHLMVGVFIGFLFIYIGIADRQNVIKEIKENGKNDKKD